MSFRLFGRALCGAGLTTACLLGAPVLTVAQAPTTTPAPASQAAKPSDRPAESMPPLPAEAHVEQSMQLDGKTLKYTATVGAMPVFGR